ncbi:hypothetical protein KC319_g3254, partial [Hortaea werneckii]
IASPNYMFGIYDGDGSAFNLSGPPGSAQAEAFFEDWFASNGLNSVPTEFSGRSDYGPFLDAGIPAGGLFTGAEVEKTEEEAALFGGTAGVAFDPNYHQVGDNYTNLNFEAFVANTKAIAAAVAEYGTSFESIPAGNSTTKVKRSSSGVKRSGSSHCNHDHPKELLHLGERTLRLEHHPLHNLRRASRQVKDEYEKEMLLHAKATIYLEAGNETNTLIIMSVAFAYVPFLGRLKHVRVRMDYDSGKKIVLIRYPSARHFCRTVVRRFPDILTLEVYFGVYLPALEVLLNRRFFTLDDFFNMGLGPSKAQQKFQVNMLLRGHLWDAARITDPEGRVMRHLMDFLYNHPENTITYKGTLSDDADGWYGMHLETWSAGTFNYDAIFAEYEAFVEDSQRLYVG